MEGKPRVTVWQKAVVFLVSLVFASIAKIIFAYPAGILTAMTGLPDFDIILEWIAVISSVTYAQY